MTLNLESVIRPFETTDISPPQKVPESQSVSAKNVVVNVGSGGSVKTMSGSYNLTITYYMVEQPKEKQQQQ